MGASSKKLMLRDQEQRVATMLVIFVGPPGAGKGTQSVRLAKYLGVPHCSTGEMFRQACLADTEIGHQANEYMQSGRLVPDALVQTIVAERLVQPDCKDGCVMDGFPRTLVQAQAFDTWCKDNYLPVSKVIEFQVDEQTLLSRLDGRGRADDAAEVVKERLRQYRELTMPLLDYYRKQGVLATVSGIGEMDDVFGSIKAALES